jgi:hypothetical protein
MTMAGNLKLARLYLLLLAIVAVGRWSLGFRHVPYDQGTDKLSIVIMTLFASVFYAAFTRRWLGYRLLQAVALTMLLGLLGQVVVFLSTVASYALGIDTYFNNPMALTRQPEAVGFAQAMGVRVGGLVANTFLNGIAGSLGWVMGGVLPAATK